METIGKILDWLKSPKQSGSAFVASLALLLAPLKVREFLGLLPLERYRGYLTVFMVLSGAFLFVECISLLVTGSKRNRRVKSVISEREGSIRDLSAEEKGIMLGYLLKETQYLHLNDGNVGALTGKGIIYRASPVGRHTAHGPLYAYNIQPWAKDYINSHPEILDGAVEPSLPPTPVSHSFFR